MKRYVMLEDKIIIDTKDRLLFHIEENTLWHNSMLQGAILNQSDNLIDLLEVGDCVETVVNELDTDIIYVSDEIDLKYVRDDYNILVEEEQVILKAIWKRNGGVMRRYER